MTDITQNVFDSEYCADDSSTTRSFDVTDWLVGQCWSRRDMEQSAPGLSSAFTLISNERPDRERDSSNYFSQLAASTMVRLAQSEPLIGRPRRQWCKAVESMVNSVPTTDKVAVLKTIDRAGVCSQTELGTFVATAARSISADKRSAFEIGDLLEQRHCAAATKELSEYVIGLSSAARKQYFIHLASPGPHT